MISCSKRTKQGHPCRRKLKHGGPHSNGRHCISCDTLLTHQNTSPSALRVGHGYCHDCMNLYVHARKEKQPQKQSAHQTRWDTRKFFRLVLPKNPLTIANIAEIIKSNPTLRGIGVSDKRLREIAGANGFPDWMDEGIEEKKVTDWFRPPQIARAVLYYRQGRVYSCAERTSRTTSRMHPTIWGFILERLQMPMTRSFPAAAQNFTRASYHLLSQAPKPTKSFTGALEEELTNQDMLDAEEAL